MCFLLGWCKSWTSFDAPAYITLIQLLFVPCSCGASSNKNLPSSSQAYHFYGTSSPRSSRPAGSVPGSREVNVPKPAPAPVSTPHREACRPLLSATVPSRGGRPTGRGRGYGRTGILSPWNLCRGALPAWKNPRLFSPNRREIVRMPSWLGMPIRVRGFGLRLG